MRIGLVGVLLILVAGCSRERPPDRIILIVVDTLRRDYTSPYGADIATPNLQALADRGQVFTRAVSSFHQTTMSMAALFTGRTPSLESGDLRKPLRWTGRSWCGLKRFAASPDDSCVPKGLKTVAEELRSAGYWTIGVTSNRLLFDPAGYSRGFDSWTEVSSKRSDLERAQLIDLRSAPHVLDAVRRATESLPDGPIFLYVHFVDVHDWRPFGGSGYAGAVVGFDRALGELLELLEQRGLLEDSVIVFTADHGEALGEEHVFGKKLGHTGNPSFQSVLEIPLIVSPPRGRDETRMIRSQDLARFLVELGGVEDVEGLVGTSPGALADDELLTTEMRFVTYRKGRWKSVFHREKMSRWALFDLESDPGETRNLIQTERAIAREHLKRVRELTDQLRPAAIFDDQLTEEDRSRLQALGYAE